MEWDGESELTADEAAEYIYKNGTGEGIIIFRPNKNDNNKYLIAEIRYWNTTGGKMYQTYEYGETLTEALNAAARAVYEKGKTLYCQNCDQELPGCNCTGMD